MDGNGRWGVKKRNKSRNYGHLKGVETVKEVVSSAAIKLKVPLVTFYVFSSENWRRPRSEVINFLFKLIKNLFLERN